MMIKHIPVVSGGLPLIGHMLDFGKDPDGFMQRCYAQYGDTFKIRLGKEAMNILINPHDIHEMYANKQRAFSATKSNRLISQHVFGSSLDAYDRTVHAQIDIMRKHLAKNNLHDYNLKMQNTLEAVIFQESSAHWQDIELYSFLSRLIYKAGSAALVSDTFASDDSYRDFKVFDDNVFYILGGAPKVFFRKAIAARNRINQRFQQTSQVSNAMQLERYHCFEENGIRAYDVAANDTSIFWAANSNTIVVAYWVILHLYRDPSVRGLLQEEMNTALQDSHEYSATGKPVLTLPVLEKLKKMDSFIDEALRHYSSIFSRRIAVKDTAFETRNGIYHIEEGEYVAGFSRICSFFPEIYEDPYTFQWDRYLNQKSFYYQGDKIKSMQFAFGGGQNICPGRWFSRNEFKIVIATLLQFFDFQLMESHLPEVNLTRSGTGTLPPKDKIKARYKLK
ncbi:MAG: cytochrome P450 [Pseudomonadales bacterium]|nr:cytochrome P450 [Pseudomonadales bacterium]